MPYIRQSDRQEPDRAMEPLLALVIKNNSPGFMNYVITNLIIQFFDNDPSYARIALTTGVIENVKQEFYRRVAGPYEDKKIAENGDVY